MPVISVAQMRTLAAQGKLNGRFGAVGGYWMQYALPCPEPVHPAVLAGYCSGGKFADSEQEAADPGGGLGGPGLPLAAPETGNGDLLWSATGNGPAAVVLIVHGADARSWQCSPDQRAACATSLVIDQVAWINGSEVPLASGPATLVTLQEQLVTTYELNATGMNDVDPRFNGEASGPVWYARTAYGPVDADGTVGGVARAVSVATSAIVDERTLAVSDKYTPGRVVFDASQTDNSDSSRYPQFSVSDATSEYVAGALGNQTPPVVLYPSTYNLTAWLGTAGAVPAASPSQSCVEQITVEASSNVAYSATFTKNGCQWSRTDSTP